MLCLHFTSDGLEIVNSCLGSKQNGTKAALLVNLFLDSEAGRQQRSLGAKLLVHGYQRVNVSLLRISPTTVIFA